MNSIQLYPLKFVPIYKEKIWGGKKIEEILKKDVGSLANCGESWEISGVEGDLSIVANGAAKGMTLPQIISEFKGRVVGQKIYEKFGHTFPLLVKFIDANDDLSIQVHPSDQIARKRHDCFGKTEMWYVVQADTGSKLFCGFKKEVTQDQFKQYAQSNKILEVLNEDEVDEGDVYFLPSGRVHSIGKGLLIAEIQQTSDITYRVYDFNRRDKHGEKRELHIDEAADVIDYEIHDTYQTKYENHLDERIPLANCSYFTTNKLDLTRMFSWNAAQIDSFIIYMCLKGQGTINGETIRYGESILIPAELNEILIEPDNKMELLESYVEK